MVDGAADLDPAEAETVETDAARDTLAFTVGPDEAGQRLDVAAAQVAKAQKTLAELWPRMVKI